jgi:hypothetical protein
MVMWTVVPETSIFSPEPPASSPVLENKPEEIEYAGCKILAQATVAPEYQIVRLISTNPADYLNNKLEPGKIIRYKKIWV